MKKTILNWLPLAAAITGVFFTIYVAVQQNYRMSAYDPQVQMAQDAAAQLAKGQTPTFMYSGLKFDLARSLDTAQISYNESGVAIASSALLDGKTPELPKGVIDYVKTHGEDRITWQPKSGVRLAAVITKYQSSTKTGYVLAARSLTEVEKRISRLGLITLAGWGATIIASFVLSFGPFLMSLLLAKNQAKES